MFRKCSFTVIHFHMALRWCHILKWKNITIQAHPPNLYYEFFSRNAVQQCKQCQICILLAIAFLESCICLLKSTYIHHRNHISCWYSHTHGYPATEKSFLDTLSCMLTRDRSFLRTVCLCPHSLPKTSSLLPGEIHHIQTNVEGLYIDHVYHLWEWEEKISPQLVSFSTQNRLLKEKETQNKKQLLCSASN